MQTHANCPVQWQVIKGWPGLINQFSPGYAPQHGLIVRNRGCHAAENSAAHIKLEQQTPKEKLSNSRTPGADRADILKKQTHL